MEISAPARPRSRPRMAVLDRPGARLAYQVTGDGPAIVLVHGFGLDQRMWDAQAEHLAGCYQVVRYDCRGFGASGPFDPAVAYTHAGDLLALLDHLGIGQAVLAGLSFGGRVILQAALAAPDRVRGLALLDAVLDGVPWDPESEAAIGRAVQLSRTHGMLAGREAWLAHPLFAAARTQPAVADRLAAMVSGYPGQHWIGHDPHEPDERPLIDALADLTVPALVLVGELDVPGFREMSAVLARQIPGARYQVVPGPATWSTWSSRPWSMTCWPVSSVGCRRSRRPKSRQSQTAKPESNRRDRWIPQQRITRRPSAGMTSSWTPPGWPRTGTTRQYGSSRST